MSSAYRIAIFASGQGSNFQTMVDAAQSGTLGVEIVLLVCDKAQAPVVERARKAGIDCYVFDPKSYPKREDYETEIAAELEKRNVDLVVLAGYMRLLTSVLVERYAGKMINIHPSLLPAFPGKNAIGQAWDYGVKVTGITVHFVDGGMDSGPVIAQQAVEITAEDTLSTLEEKIHQAEKQLYPKVVNSFAKGFVSLQGRQVSIQM